MSEIKPIAGRPISWTAFQEIMGELGYEMTKKDPANRRIIFKLKMGASTEGLKNPVSIAFPDYSTRDQKEAAYEKDYVIDLITQIAGQNGGESLATFYADRRMDS